MDVYLVYRYANDCCSGDILCKIFFNKDSVIKFIADSNYPEQYYYDIWDVEEEITQKVVYE